MVERIVRGAMGAAVWPCFFLVTGSLVPNAWRWLVLMLWLASAAGTISLFYGALRNPASDHVAAPLLGALGLSFLALIVTFLLLRIAEIVARGVL